MCFKVTWFYKKHSKVIKTIENWPNFLKIVITLKSFSLGLLRFENYGKDIAEEYNLEWSGF